MGSTARRRVALHRRPCIFALQLLEPAGNEDKLDVFSGSGRTQRDDEASGRRRVTSNANRFGSVKSVCGVPTEKGRQRNRYRHQAAGRSGRPVHDRAAVHRGCMPPVVGDLPLVAGRIRLHEDLGFACFVGLIRDISSIRRKHGVDFVGRRRHNREDSFLYVRTCSGRHVEAEPGLESRGPAAIAPSGEIVVGNMRQGRQRLLGRGSVESLDDEVTDCHRAVVPKYRREPSGLHTGNVLEPWPKVNRCSPRLSRSTIQMSTCPSFSVRRDASTVR